MKTKYKVERSLLIKREQLSNNDYNPNKTTERQQEAIAESLGSYGQLTSVLVRPDPDKKDNYIIIDGEHRSKVLEEELYVDVVHNLSIADAKKLTVIMNETRGSADKIELAQLLSSIEEELGGIEELGVGLPYDDTELQELIELASVDWEDYGSDGDDDEDEEEESEDDDWTVISCKVPNDVLDIINQAIALVKDENDLDKDLAISNGQVLEELAGNYLALPKYVKS